MATDDSGAPHAAPAAGLAASPASHRPPRPDDASGDVVRAVVGARAERQALLDALDAERTQRARAERERDHALQRVSELEAQLLENDEELERTLHELQVITKAETARAEKAAADLRRERALASAALLRESDAELERRLSSPPESAQHSPRHAAPAPAFGFESSPFGADESTAAAVSETESNGGAEAAVQALASKLLEQRRARARASAERFAQQAHKHDEFAVFASAAAAAAADTTLSLSEALQVAETTPPQATPEAALPLRSMMGPRRSSSAGQLSSNGGSPGLLALPPPSGWQAFASATPARTPPASPQFPGWVQF